MTIQSYRDLDVWRRGVDLAVICHALLKQFPAEERFALTAQMRRASVSVPSNIAEGNASGYRALYASSVGRSLGSLAELETQMSLAQRFGYVGAETRPFWAVSGEVGRMLVSLRQSLTVPLRGG
ncbi:MAG TPA: four helix bundle protein [Gemmatimonadaceae bacterium]|nr:four helix bundle protein [Gemmatimonadaceae bacterium]